MIVEFLASEGGIALLDVNPGLAIWTTISFFVVFFLLKFFAWGPISQALDARAEKIHSDIDRAESIRSEAEQKLAEYMEKLEGLKAEGQDILAEAKKQADAMKSEIVEAAKKEAESMKEKSKQELKLATDQALETIHKEVSDLSVSIAARILGRDIKAADHSKLIEESLKQVKGLN